MSGKVTYTSEFEKAKQQIINGEKVTCYGCDTTFEQHILSIVNGNGIEGLPDPINRTEELLQLLSLAKKYNGGGGSGGTVIDVALFQRAMEHLSGQKIGFECSSVNEVLQNINSLYEIAKIVVNATDSSTGQAISDISITVLNASAYKKSDGYYYIPASDTEWTMRVSHSNYNMKSVTFTVTEEAASAGELVINIEMVARAT